MASRPRSVPNILITGNLKCTWILWYVFIYQLKLPLPINCISGTPGVGKSTISRKLADQTKYVWREVSRVAEEHNCLDEYDPQYQCPFLIEDKVTNILSTTRISFCLLRSAWKLVCRHLLLTMKFQLNYLSSYNLLVSLWYTHLLQK